MKKQCEIVQNLLLEGTTIGATNVASVKVHLASCAECSAVAASIQSLAQLETILPKHDAPEVAVSAVIARVQAAQSKKQASKKLVNKFKIPFFWIAIASLAIGLAISFIVFSQSQLIASFLAGIEGAVGVGLMVGFFAAAITSAAKHRFKLSGSFVTASVAIFLMRSVSATFFSTDSIEGYGTESWDKPALTPEGTNQNSPYESRNKKDGLRQAEKITFFAKEPIGSPLQSDNSVSFKSPGSPSDLESTLNNQLISPLAVEEITWTLTEPGVAAGMQAAANGERKLNQVKPENLPSGISTIHIHTGNPGAEETINDLMSAFKGDVTSLKTEVSERKSIREADKKDAEEANARMAEILKTVLTRMEERDAQSKNKVATAESSSGYYKLNPKQKLSSVTSGITTEKYIKIENKDGDAISTASNFWSERQSTQNLQFKSPKGYWSNTYIPGDPMLRALVAKLEGSDKAALANFSSESLDLEKISRPALQPLDIPSGAALGVSLTGDVKATSGPTRMLLQLSLKAAERKSTLRQPLHVAIVLDAAGTANSELVSAALNAFDRSKIEGDKFSLVTSGANGGTIIPIGDYRYGTVQAALEKLAKVKPTAEKNVDLKTTLAEAIKQVKNSESADAVFGTSLVVLLSGSDLKAQAKELTAVAYQGAVDGVPVSSIALGAAADYETLGDIALAGQGSRRQILSNKEAEGLVREELAATSKIVARAIRINLKLAPGVKLVDVLGSKNLSEEAAERLRQAEKSVDQRMERNFGITANRGADDDGIQIIIPAFYSGDAHVVLIDLVTNGAGPVAEAQIKYKDLLEHKNGEARSAFALMAGEKSDKERDALVLKNFLSFRISKAFESAVAKLEQGNSAAAIATLEAQKQELAEVKATVKALAGDADLERDITMIEQYLALLRSGAATDSRAKVSLLQSMELAGKFKLSASVIE